MTVQECVEAELLARAALRELGWDYERLLVARSFGQRLRGLLSSQNKHGLVLVFPRCTSVHSFGMRRPFSVAFIDRDGKPLTVINSMRPNAIASNAKAALIIEKIP